jgi:hypothetical protein
MGKSTINDHFQFQTVGLPEGNSITRILTGWWFGTFFGGEWNNHPN